MATVGVLLLAGRPGWPPQHWSRLMTNGGNHAVPEIELTFAHARLGLKFDTNLASMQRVMTDAAHLGNAPAPQQQ